MAEILNSVIISDVWSFFGLAFFMALGMFFVSLFTLAVYIYSSYAWFTIGNKLKYKKSWLAWIPLINIAMILELGGFYWAWILLIFIPVLGWIPLFVLIIIATWKIFEKRSYPGWFSLSMIIPKIGGILFLIALGIVAWSDNHKKKRKRNK